MQACRDKVAVVTGAASGIGQGLAAKSAALGMKVVIADIDADSLRAMETKLREQGATVLAVRTDVADYESVTALADATWRQFGKVNFLFNNAGVLVDGLSWERSVEDWRWSFDVNTMDVVHGIKAFVPRMLESGEDGVVINTASQAGLIVGPFLGPYTASKHAVVGSSETLHDELSLLNAKVKAAVLCPGEVATRIWDSERQRPQQYGEKPRFSTDAETTFREIVSTGVARGMSPAQLADFVFDALAQGKFWRFPHPDFKAIYTRRYETVIDEQTPEVMKF